MEGYVIVINDRFDVSFFCFTNCKKFDLLRQTRENLRRLQNRRNVAERVNKQELLLNLYFRFK